VKRLAVKIFKNRILAMCVLIALIDIVRIVIKTYKCYGGNLYGIYCDEMYYIHIAPIIYFFCVLYVVFFKWSVRGVVLFLLARILFRIGLGFYAYYLF